MKRTSLLAAGSIAAMMLGSTLAASAQAPTASILQNFTGNFVGGSGSTIVKNDGFIPPDTMGAVGTNNFIQMINGGYSVYSKTGTLQNANNTTDINFWTAAGIGGLGTGTGQTQISDPHILFDPNSNHWFASEITIPSGSNANSFLVAISKDSNPLDGFSGYSYAANVGAGTNFADFDMLGINSQGIYVGANMFDTTGSGAGQDVRTVSKADLLAGATAPTSSLIYSADANVYGFGVRPAVDQDNGGTAANVNEAALGVDNNTFGSVYANTISGTVTTSALTHDATYTFTTSTAGAGFAHQKGGVTTIDTGDDRFSGYVVKQNGVIYAASTLADPTTGLADIHITAVNAITKALVIDQLVSGTGKGTGGTNLDLYYPSLAINAAGQVVIGYTGSGPSDLVGAYAISGQLAVGGGSITFGSQIQTAAGKGTYNVTFGSGRNRFGDYSSTTLDPTDPTKFWTVQEFAIAKNEWGTQITEFGLAAAPEPSQYAAFGIGLLGLGALVFRARRRSADAPAAS